jgi:hypothetical protein
MSAKDEGDLRPQKIISGYSYTIPVVVAGPFLAMADLL